MTHEQRIIDKQKELIEHLLGAFEAQSSDGLVEYHFKRGRLMSELQSLESSQPEKSEPEKTPEEILNSRIKIHRNEYIRSLPLIYKEAVLEAMEEYAQSSPVTKEMTEALETALKAIHDIVRQLPNDERLADFNLDYCEIAEGKIKKALEYSPAKPEIKQQ